MMHPAEREYLDEATTLLVTVETDQQFHEEVTANLERLERGESADSTPTLSFHSYDDLMSTFTSSTLDLIAAIRREQPASMNEAARVVERDVKNVHDQLTRLESLGVIYFAEEGQSKRPVVWFDDLVIDIPFDEESEPADRAVASG
jgi:predicted transcriptional regulator